jgi:hypothetical protein
MAKKIDTSILEIRRARDYLRNRNGGFKTLTEQGVKHYLTLAKYYKDCCNNPNLHTNTLRHKNFKTLDKSICPFLYAELSKQFDIDSLNKKIILAKKQALIQAKKKVHYKYRNNHITTDWDFDAFVKQKQAETDKANITIWKKKK